MDKKYIGYFCCHVPVEIISAANLIPFHMNGLGEFEEKSYGYFPGNFCMFARNCFNQGCFLDRDKFKGIIFSNSCDAMERLYDIWKKYLSSPFVHMLEVPRKNDEAAEKFFFNQLGFLKNNLEKHFDCHISDELLSEEINKYNKARELFREIKNFRKKVEYNIPSSKIMNIISSNNSIEKINLQFEEMLEGKEDFHCAEKKMGPRIMLAGSIMEDLKFVELIEKFGANIVYEDFCSSERFWSEKVDTGLPPLKALALRYLNNPTCARFKDSIRQRIDKTKDLIRRYSINGIIFYLVKFCDIFSWETQLMASEFRSTNIPVLVIEGDYPVKTRGQTATRVEAFLEMVEEEKE